MILPPHRAVVALVAAAVVAGTAPGVAEARVRTTCAPRTKVLNTPGGLVVGFLARGAQVLVRKHTHDGNWTEVRALHSLVGWIHTQDLC